MRGGNKKKMKTITKKEAIEQAQESKVIQTICDGCCFCVALDKSEEHDLNEHCMADRLEILESQGGRIYSIVDESSENSVTKAIDGRVCTMMRNETWEEIKKSKGLGEEELVKEARKELEISCAFLIYMGKNDTVPEQERLDNLLKTIQSAEDGDVKPGHFFIINNAGIKAYTMLTYLRKKLKELDIKTKWNMEYILEDSVKELEEKEAVDRCVDMIYKNINKNYYCIFKDADIVPRKYISSIDSAINDELKRFLVLEPENGDISGTFIIKFAHKQFKGNRGGNLIDKIKTETEEQKCQKMVLTVESIVQDQS